jgi:hypothetical protein
MKLWQLFLTLFAVWISVVGSMAHDSDVGYTIKVKEPTDDPAGTNSISPEERGQVISALNDNLVTTDTNPGDSK